MLLNSYVTQYIWSFFLNSLLSQIHIQVKFKNVTEPVLILSSHKESDLFIKKIISWIEIHKFEQIYKVQSSNPSHMRVALPFRTKSRMNTYCSRWISPWWNSTWSPLQGRKDDRIHEKQRGESQMLGGEFLLFAKQC